MHSHSHPLFLEVQPSLFVFRLSRSHRPTHLPSLFSFTFISSLCDFGYLNVRYINSSVGVVEFGSGPPKGPSCFETNVVLLVDF
jgi:hypothetical protein